ncbi:MAG: 4Fe-4S binding protein [Synergistaceae bacterium]|nr:4Fe-4S binding protein [Synergistaceae bacterium]
MYEDVIEVFEVPEEGRAYVADFLSVKEIAAIRTMGRTAYLPEELQTLLSPLTANPTKLIAEAYSRAVFNKVKEDGQVKFQTANFYRRLAFFAQYEPDAWTAIPRPHREAMDAWYVKIYAEGARSRLEVVRKNPEQLPEQLIENAYFVTLDEAFDIIDKLEHDPYRVPCNCKSVAMNCEKPRNVCVLFEKGINSEWDRGHGQALTKAEAKELLRFANKNGLMQTSELRRAICNCDGCCCYPIRASRMIGARGFWPKKLYNIVWDEGRCVNCKKCTSICNFRAFIEKEGKVFFERENCWGCAICKSNCPVNAISLERAE